MKKILTVCLAAALVLSFSSCSKAKKASVEEPVVSESEISSASDAEETEETMAETSAETTTQTSVASTTAAGTGKTTAAKSANKTTSAPPKTTKDVTDDLKKKITNPIPSGDDSSTAPSSNSSTGGNTVQNVTPPVSTKTPTDIQKQYYAAYQKASQKTNALASFDYSTSLKLDMEETGQSSYSLQETGNIKMATNGSNIKMLENETMQEIGGNSETMSLYYADGTLYLSVNGQKEKLKLDPSELQSETGVSLTGSSSDLSENDFAYSESTSSNGDTVITLDLTPESTKEIVNSSLAGLGNDMNFSKIAFRFVINKDGYVVRQEMECNATLTETENGKTETANIYLSLTITLNNPGQPVTITPPSDLSSYKEITESDL